MTATNPDRRARIVALLRQGLHAPTIATKEQCSPSLVRKIATQEGIALQRPGRPAGPLDDRAEALRQEAIRLHLEEGLSAAQIGGRIGRSERSVSGYLSSVRQEK